MSKVRFLHSWTLEPGLLFRHSESENEKLLEEDIEIDAIETPWDRQTFQWQLSISPNGCGLGDILVACIKGSSGTIIEETDLSDAPSTTKLKRKNGTTIAKSPEADIDVTVAAYKQRDPRNQVSRVASSLSFIHPARLSLDQLVPSAHIANSILIYRLFIDIPLKYFSKESTSTGSEDNVRPREELTGHTEKNSVLCYWKSMFHWVRQCGGTSTMDDDDYSDFRFEAGDRNYYCHKVVLKQSPIMKQMFKTHGTIECNESRATISDIDPVVFEEFLRYLYTGEIDLKAHAESLLYVAEKYQMQDLLANAEKELLLQLTPENACRLFLKADLFSLTGLTEACVQVISRERHCITLMNDWQDVSERPELVTKLFNVKTAKNASFLQLINDNGKD